MIIDLPDTTTSQVAKQLVKVREDGGAVALGRVLTLLIVAHNGVAEQAIDAANDASREHPMRVIVLITGEGSSHLDAQIRVGGDAGASEVVVLRAFGDAAPIRFGRAMSHEDTESARGVDVDVVDADRVLRDEPQGG